MTIWLIYYRKYVSKNIEFINNMIAMGAANGVAIKLVHVEDIVYDDYAILKQTSFLPTAAIARMINPGLSRILEEAGIKVFNKSNVSYICNNKAETMRRINRLGIQHIPTLAVSDNGSTYEYIDSMLSTSYSDMLHAVVPGCLEDIRTSQYIIKSVTGHGGAEVMTLEQFYNKKDTEPVALGSQESDASACYSDEYVIQPLINSRGRDLRVYVIGKEIIGAVLRQSVDGFKSNYSLGGTVSLYALSGKQTRIINRITDAFDFAYVGIDFLLTEEDGLVFNEIEDVVGSRMLSACSHTDYINHYLNYILHQS